MATMLKESSEMSTENENGKKPHLPPSAVGRNMRRYRKGMNLSLRQLDRISNVSLTTMSKWESGETQYPRYAEVTKVANALGVSVEDLYREVPEGEEDPPPTEFKFPVLLSQLFALYPDLPREDVRKWAEGLLTMDADQLRFQIRATAIWENINLEAEKDAEREQEGRAKSGPRRRPVKPSPKQQQEK